MTHLAASCWLASFTCTDHSRNFLLYGLPHLSWNQLYPLNPSSFLPLRGQKKHLITTTCCDTFLYPNSIAFVSVSLPLSLENCREEPSWLGNSVESRKGLTVSYYTMIPTKIPPQQRFRTDKKETAPTTTERSFGFQMSESKFATLLAPWKKTTTTGCYYISLI